MEMLIPVAVLYIAGRHRRFSLEASVLRVSAATLALASLLLSGSRGGLLALSAEIAIATSTLRQAGARTYKVRGGGYAPPAAPAKLEGAPALISPHRVPRYRRVFGAEILTRPSAQYGELRAGSFMILSFG
jgi:hypothetical protein